MLVPTRSPSSSIPGSTTGTLPTARMIRGVSRVVDLPSAAVTATLPGPASRPVPAYRVTLFFLSRASIPLASVADHVVLALHHRGQIECHAPDPHAVGGQVVPRPLRTCGSTPAAPSTECSRPAGRCPRASPPSRRRPPRAPAGPPESPPRSRPGRRRSPPGHALLKAIAHTSSIRRVGSSIVSLIRLRKVTASRPSTSRWS